MEAKYKDSYGMVKVIYTNNTDHTPEKLVVSRLKVLDFKAVNESKETDLAASSNGQKRLLLNQKHDSGLYELEKFLEKNIR